MEESTLRTPRNVRIVFKVVFYLSVVSAMLFCTSVLFTFYAPYVVEPSRHFNNDTPHVLLFPPEQNLRQTKNACGIYAVTAAIHAIGLNHLVSTTYNGRFAEKDLELINVTTNQIEKKILRLPNGYILPISLQNSVESYPQLDASAQNFSRLTNQQKIDALKSLSGLSPIIILGRKDGSLHYLTILGHEGDTFFVYDSLLPVAADKVHTIDSNGNGPGNISLSATEILTFWNEGGWHGLYKNFLLEINPTTDWM